MQPFYVNPPSPQEEGKARRTWLAVAASLILPALLVVVLIAILAASRRGAESALSGLASLLPVSYAFSAGMVASVNPCGFMLLPTYVLYHLGSDQADFQQLGTGRRVFKALYLGLVATLGFVAIFALTGGVVAAGGRWLNAVFPHVRAVVGVALVLLGGWLLVTGRPFGLLAASRVSLTPKRNLGNVLLFGMVYAISSLSCTLPIFLVVVGSALASRSWIYALGQFVSYALGMGVVFVAATVGAALLRHALALKLKRTILLINRFSALLLVGVGAYLFYDWLSNL